MAKAAVTSELAAACSRFVFGRNVAASSHGGMACIPQAAIAKLPREDRAMLRPWLLARYDVRGYEQHRHPAARQAFDARNRTVAGRPPAPAVRLDQGAAQGRRLAAGRLTNNRWN